MYTLYGVEKCCSRNIKLLVTVSLTAWILYYHFYEILIRWFWAFNIRLGLSYKKKRSNQILLQTSSLKKCVIAHICNHSIDLEQSIYCIYNGSIWHIITHQLAINHKLYCIIMFSMQINWIFFNPLGTDSLPCKVDWTTFNHKLNHINVTVIFYVGTNTQSRLITGNKFAYNSLLIVNQ